MEFSNEFDGLMRSRIAPRRVLIQKSSDNFSGSGALVSRSFGSSLGSAAFGGAVTTVTDQRKTEKREMQDLNERFAGQWKKLFDRISIKFKKSI